LGNLGLLGKLRKPKKGGWIRNDFPKSVIEAQKRKQRYKCRSCKRHYRRILEADHMDSNPTNNRPSNCQMLCPNCHAYKSKYIDTKRRALAKSMLKDYKKI